MNKPRKSIIKYKQKLGKLGGYAVLGTGFAIPLSTSLVSIFSGLAVFMWIISGKFKDLPTQFAHKKVLRVSLLLFALLVVGLFYSSANLQQSLVFLKKYRELFLLVVFASLLSGSSLRKWGMYSFLAGASVLLLLSYSSATIGIPSSSRFGPTLISSITHNVFLAFISFWAAHEFTKPGKFRWLWAGLLVMATLNIFTMVVGRTGQVIYLALLLLFIHQRLKRKKQIAVIATSVILLVCFFSLSKTFSARVREVGEDIQKYQAGNTYTSIGLRIEWAKNTIDLVKRKPIWGYGTGSFPQEYEKLAAKAGVEGTNNPHNEYLLIASQVGVIGVFLFLYLYFVMWRESAKLEKEEEWLAKGLVITMALGCLANSFILDSLEGHFFAFFSAIFFADHDKNKIGKEAGNGSTIVRV